MALEQILARSIRGLGNAFGFDGAGRVAPPGIDTSIPAQTIADMSQFARFGASRRPDLADGWVMWGVRSPLAIGAAITILSTNLTSAIDAVGVQVPREGDTFWLYGTGFFYVGTLADITRAVMSALAPDNANLGADPLLVADMPLAMWTDVPHRLTATTAWFRPAPGPEFSPGPRAIPWGSTLNLAIDKTGAAAVGEVHWQMWGRFMPPGIPPLP